MNNLMNKKMKKAVEKKLEQSANTMCWFLFHQPKAPVSLKKFSKIK